MNHGTLELFGLNSYHNSVNERDERKLTAYEETTRKQDNAVLGFLKRYDCECGWTAQEILDDERGGFKMLITSMRRALTDLCKDEKIRVVGKREGEHGRDCLTYRSEQ